ncbi:MAG: hypothetical protein IJO48_05550 [Clostridia bacterium]|nr:hypothetical protein [Clostridia bacterium]
MQRVAQSSVPPRRNSSNNSARTNQSVNNNGIMQNESPAFMLAMRIKNEQGAHKAAEYLLAMEPYLAPAERMHISSRLGLPQVKKEVPKSNNMPQANQNTGGGMNFANMGNMGGINNPMNLINMLSKMNGSGAKNTQNMPDPAMMARLMSMMGKK